MEAVILVEPEIPENTGFIARLTDNFSTELKIVNPQFQLEKARETATNAQQKLRYAKIYDTVEEAVQGLDQVIGTKPGKGLPVKEFEPRKNTSVMIGRESSGLSNEELELCDAIVHIDLPGYQSMNQSHATAVLLHQLDRTEGQPSLKNKQKKALKKKIGDRKIYELILRGSPVDGEFDRIMGEIHNLDD